ncbi:cytochrome b/b6 domain-containing protein [Oceanobacter mangrovi]|uniref:cytochrome b/b6 domain-containing protein n=1 Tax=Oceanobacter mangrovi TaxID=2862510 RepID=UPI001C8DAFB9|nr:cytochrome b/b6 domain-containing protein [Oceanobacter mangrovi]
MTTANQHHHQPAGQTSHHTTATPARVRVWDLATRLFHWSLASFFLIAWLSAKEIESVHVIAGYSIGGLLLFRLIWGVIGSRHARFSDFVTRPATLKRYFSDTLKGRSGRYLGHNPAGGAMVIALLLSLSATVSLGLILIGGDGDGPLAGMAITALPVGLVKGAHELFANLSLLLVVLHLGGVLFSSLHHRENLVRAMITGLKPSRAGDIDHSQHTTTQPAPEHAHEKR